MLSCLGISQLAPGPVGIVRELECGVRLGLRPSQARGGETTDVRFLPVLGRIGSRVRMARTTHIAQSDSVVGFERLDQRKPGFTASKQPGQEEQSALPFPATNVLQRLAGQAAARVGGRGAESGQPYRHDLTRGVPMNTVNKDTYFAVALAGYYADSFGFLSTSSCTAAGSLNRSAEIFVLCSTLSTTISTF